MRHNVGAVVKEEKCCSCGICAGVCPVKCIQMKLDQNKVPVPVIDAMLCTHCGLCLDICPGKESFNETLCGGPRGKEATVLQAYNGHTKNESLLITSASGGICMQLIDELLKTGVFKKAFLVKEWNLSKILTTELCEAVCPSMGGSRYVPVSHEKAVKYILQHRDEKVILVGTGCAIRGLRNVIQTFHLNDNNYLLLGLFCDSVMSYSIWDYFLSVSTSYGKLKELHFRSKKKHGWPGDVLLVCDKGEVYFPKEKRQRIKDFYINKRCLYCTDKLCSCADISLGDNYTGTFVNKMGTSSIFVRTDKGKKYLNRIESLLEFQEIAPSLVERAQQIEKTKEKNWFAKIKEKECKEVPLKYKIKYCYKMVKIFSRKYKLLMNAIFMFERIFKR